VNLHNLFKPGDILIVLLSAALTAGLFVNAWSKPAGGTLVIRSQGQMMVRATLLRDADFAVPGMLGMSRIEVRNGRARVVADPGPRQICVKQGWLSRAGEAALCLANQVSMEIGGSAKPFASVNY